MTTQQTERPPDERIAHIEGVLEVQNERIGDICQHMEGIEQRVDAHRAENRAEFAAVRTEISQLREEIAALRKSVEATNRTVVLMLLAVIAVGGGIIATLAATA